MKSINDTEGTFPEDIVIEKSIYIWIDILGFKEATENESKYKELSEALILFQDKFENDKNYKTYIISDGLVLIIEKLNFQKFISILGELGKLQASFIMEKELFLRGGIAIGSRVGNRIFEDNDVRSLLGNGLSRAYAIESKCITWPVIGTNQKNIEEIRKLLEIVDEQEFFDLRRSFNKKGEYIYYIDFLNYIDKGDIGLFMELLKRKIIEFSKEKEDYEIRNKYIWLLRYCCKQFGPSCIPEDLNRVVL